MRKLTVNGRVVEVDADDKTPLLWALREQLGLTGTKYGCGIAQCGSCTVHVDGAPVRSCALPIAAVSATAAALLADKPKPTDADIDATMTNICRCGTYNKVRAAIHLAADNVAKS